MPSITYFIRTFRRDRSEIFPAEVHEHIALGKAWDFFRAYATPTAPTCTVLARPELGERY